MQYACTCMCAVSSPARMHVRVCSHAAESNAKLMSWVVQQC